MSGINLQKRVQEVGIILAKRGLAAVPRARVGVALDVSGSARDLYSRGIMQEALDRLLAVAIKFDDNGELDTWVFDTSSYELPAMTANDYGTYVQSNIMGNRKLMNNIWGGTQYAPPLEDAMEHYFPTQAAVVEQEKPGFFGRLFGTRAAPIVEKAPTPAAKSEPAMLLFITDGENFDRSEARKVLQVASDQKHPVYFQMIGIGNSSFDFLEQMADDLPNVGFVNLTSLNITDEALYEQVVNEEFVEWMKKV